MSKNLDFTLTLTQNLVADFFPRRQKITMGFGTLDSLNEWGLAFFF